ncbi:hypothetical protein Pmani_020596 [Petrolisthes manimaculis]|uniref:Uncharacterized protein n=1 Tax=Petrolisthes manimaculis TaxID=1843537 RepID=A0AAE1U6E1_9EUCA|nr:hypothetical protein Pmani_020596 [Petrolisthes manimaculis]
MCRSDSESWESLNTVSGQGRNICLPPGHLSNPSLVRVLHLLSSRLIAQSSVRSWERQVWWEGQHVYFGQKKPNNNNTVRDAHIGMDTLKHM